MEWRTDDSDPALRFWTLPYDPHLNRWLESVDPSAPSTMAALEFGSQHEKWRFNEGQLLAAEWLEDGDVAWQSDRDGFAAIRPEIEQLRQLMQDDRRRYLAEAEQQADGVVDYFVHFLGASQARHPWTIELIRCGMSISHIAHMYYKHYFRRVRPSFLCPGLIPPFGPPAHPSFPSGHSFQGHLIALLLLEIPGLAQRYGIFNQMPNPGVGQAPQEDTLSGTGEFDSPLLWLAQRLAKNRERIGVHYASDSTASRHLAAGVWWALFEGAPYFDINGNLIGDGDEIDCPTLHFVLRRAIEEWPAWD